MFGPPFTPPEVRPFGVPFTPPQKVFARFWKTRVKQMRFLPFDNCHFVQTSLDSGLQESLSLIWLFEGFNSFGRGVFFLLLVGHFSPLG